MSVGVDRAGVEQQLICGELACPDCGGRLAPWGYAAGRFVRVGGEVVRRRIFADMSSDDKDGVPDGMKVDVEGRVYCTGPGGTWVFLPDGTKLGIIRTPEVPANLAFGGPDLRTLFFTAKTSIYSLRMKVPGQPHPWYRTRPATTKH